MKILVINGPNLNLLGLREPEIYGSGTLDDLERLVKNHAAGRAQVDFYQSNHEGDIIDKIQSARGVYDGIVLNAGGYTHTSISIADAISAVRTPTVEVHISDITKREPYRAHSYLTPVCAATIMGRGFKGYTEAVDFLISL